MMAYKTGWMKKIIDGVSTKVFAFAHAKTVYTDYENKKTLSDKLSEIDTEIGNKANKTEIPTELPANGGNSATVNGHTVKTNVPENAVFTDTTYDVVTEKTNGLMSSTDKKNLDDLLDPYNRNMLADGTDFHEVTKPGSYQFHHTKTYINNPPMVNGFVDVKTYGNIVKQIAYRQGTIGTNDHEIYECTGNKAIDDWSDWVRILTTKDACGYVGGAAKATASYTLNTSHVYLIIGTGHKPSTSIDSLSCGEYIYYANSQWNRTQIFASSFPAMGITGNTLIVGYSSTTGANSCDRHILLRVK